MLKNFLEKSGWGPATSARVRFDDGEGHTVEIANASLEITTPAIPLEDFSGHRHLLRTSHDVKVRGEIQQHVLEALIPPEGFPRWLEGEQHRG